MVAGIVCEYNPFHKGHLYQLEKTRQAGADAIVCVMSGNYVQRGDCAIFDKWIRAKTAVLCGADVVIDLPVPWALSSAENFARGSISLLNEFGVDFISFGSEYDSKELLLKAAESVEDSRVITLTKKYMSEGFNYPSALYKGVSEFYSDEIACVVSSPNSTLAVEYIKQLSKYNNIDFLPVKRVGADHDSSISDGEYLSASKIRQSVVNDEFLTDALPENSASCFKTELKKDFAPCLVTNNERGILSALREMPLAEIEKYVSDENGLTQRIYDGVRASCNLAQLYDSIKVKNYTLSRIRREVLSAYLKIPKVTALSLPPYMRILAASEKGVSLLSRAKKNSAIPIVTRHSEMQNLSQNVKKLYALQCSSTDKFALFSPTVRECGLEQKSSMILVK